MYTVNVNSSNNFLATVFKKYFHLCWSSSGVHKDIGRMNRWTNISRVIVVIVVSQLAKVSS